MANLTLAQLRTRVKQLSDQENGSFISDAEIDNHINDGLAELRDIVLELSPHLLISSTDHSFSTVSGTSSYALASDHMRLVSVDLVDGNNSFTLRRTSSMARNHPVLGQYISRYSYHPLYRFYEPTNDVIRLVPTPTAAYTVNIQYIPEMTILSDDADTTEAGFEQHWLQYAVYHSCIQIKIKSEENAQYYMALKDKLEQKIRRSLSNYYTNSQHYANDVSEDWN